MQNSMQNKRYPRNRKDRGGWMHGILLGQSRLYLVCVVALAGFLWVAVAKTRPSFIDSNWADETWKLTSSGMIFTGTWHVYM